MEMILSDVSSMYRSHRNRARMKAIHNTSVSSHRNRARMKACDDTWKSSSVCGCVVHVSSSEGDFV